MASRIRGLVGALGLFTSAMTATSAGAIGTTYGATFQGTASGVDTLGLFGTKGATLSNASFSEVFLIDTLLGTKRYGSDQQDQWSTSPSFITASLTINGKTVSLKSSVYGEAFVNNGGSTTNGSTGIYYQNGYGGDNTYHAVYDYAVGTSSVSGTYVGALSSWADNGSASFKGFPTALDQSFTTSFSGTSTTGGGAFTLYTDCFEQLETLALHPSIAAAPEPDSWALMIAGVAGVGLVLRRHRRCSRAAITLKAG